MASFLDKIKINTAVKDHTKLDLSCDHISTASFMQYNVAWSKEMVPGEKISINMETFTRLQPMPVPTFGRARINNRAFFVPFRTIFPAWNDFITDVRHTLATGTNGMVSNVPLLRQRDIYEIYVNPSQEEWTLAEYVEGDELPDFYTSDEQRGYKFNSRGRWFKKLLESLGYQFVPSSDVVLYSALPLLAVAKVYYDWYYPSAYATDLIGAQIEAIFNRDNTVNPILSKDDLELIALFLNKVCYDSDYFVSAWQNPSSPNDNTSSLNYTIGDVTVEGGQSVTNAVEDGTPVIGNTTPSAIQRISQYGLDALKSLTDYMKRHQLVGARALDRYLSRFGIQLSAEKLKRSVYIGTQSEDIQFGDVMSTADTDGAQLGNYAGKGIGYGKGNFDFETDEYGIIMIISTIQPKAGYYQGINRNVMHTTRLDYWTPEFDNLGTQAISKAELFVPDQTFDGITLNGQAAKYTDIYNGVFGWAPRYAEYKVGRDMVTGDFRNASMNAGLDSWHTMREIDYTKVQDMVINQKFVTGDDSNQYNRIFYNTLGTSDKFNVIYHFNIASYSPMKALWDNYEFEDKGKKVTLNANGVKMN